MLKNSRCFQQSTITILENLNHSELIIKKKHISREISSRLIPISTEKNFCLTKDSFSCKTWLGSSEMGVASGKLDRFNLVLLIN